MNFASDPVLALRTAVFVVSAGVAALLQAVLPHGGRRGNWRTNAGLGVLGMLVAPAMGGLSTVAAASWAVSADAGLLVSMHAPLWLSVLSTVLVLDAVSYWWHRVNHRCGLLWRAHRVHHSDLGFSVTTALRFHPFELAASLPVRVSAVVLLGAEPAAVLVFEALYTFTNLVEHGDIDYPARLDRRLSRLLITPSLHRRHHSDDPRDLDSNFGTIFAIWDRLFGTFRSGSPAERLRTGVPGIRRDLGGLGALALPFAVVPSRPAGASSETGDGR